MFITILRAIPSIPLKNISYFQSTHLIRFPPEISELMFYKFTLSFLFLSASIIETGEDTMTIIGQRIKNARKNKKLSQTELAVLLGVSQPTIGNWESGNHEPRHATVSRIAYALDVRHLWLISGTEDPTDGQPMAPPIVGNQNQYLTTPIVHVPLLKWPTDAGNFLGQALNAQRHLPASLWALQPFALPICDDSMLPEFAQGTLVVFDAARTRLYDGELYLFNWNGAAVLRRWRTNPGRIEASGDANQFETLFPEKNPTVIARALQSIRELA